MEIEMYFPRIGKQKWFVFFLGFVIGALSWHCVSALLSKTDLISGSSRYERLRGLFSVFYDVGMFHFMPCSYKVAEMHRIIVDANNDNAASSDYSDSLGIVITSIIVDGYNCNDHLAMHIDSRVPIPNFSLHSEFVGAVGVVRHADQLGALLRDEQGLILWILDRIDCRIYSLVGQCSCFQKDDPGCVEKLELHRAAVVALWQENR